MTPRRRAAGLLLTLLLLGGLGAAFGGCGPLPRPFQPEQKSLTAVPDPEADGVAEVTVLPLAEDAPGEAARAATALARSLENYGIDTATDGVPAMTALTGRARLESLDGGREAIAITWELIDAAGARIASVEQRSELPGGLWETGQPGAVGIVMAQAARDLAPIIKARTASPAAGASTTARAGAPPRANQAASRAGATAGPEQRYRPRVVVLPMDGLPGDGSRSLPHALRTALRGADYEIGAQIDQGDLLVLGEVEITPTDSTWERISITWWVINANDGRDLGQIDQANELPPGALDKPWGAMAEAIAQAAAAGIIELLERYARS